MDKHKNNYKHRVSNIIAIVIPVLTILLIISVIVSNLWTRKSIQRTRSKFVSTLKESDFSSEKVGIRFGKIATTRSEYKDMQDSCKNYICKNDIAVTDIDTDVDITESTYIDTNGNSISTSDTNKYYESGPIYMDNKVLDRYINSDGQMKVVLAQLTYKNPLEIGLSHRAVSSDDYIIQTVDKEGFSKVLKKPTVKQSNFVPITESDNSFGAFSDDTGTVSSNNITEEEYLTDLGNIFTELLRKSSDDIDSSLRYKAMNYFTYDGYRTIIDGTVYIPSKSQNISLDFIESGSSEIKGKQDRVLMGIKVGQQSIDIIFKLDSNNKVFDIDIL